MAMILRYDDVHHTMVSAVKPVLSPHLVIASAAKQSIAPRTRKEEWIASLRSQ
jgi:hypothetical protein